MLRSIALFVGLAVLCPSSASGGILVTGEAPGVQKSQVPGVVTMDFNAPGYVAGSFTTLSSPLGTYTASGAWTLVALPDSWGGASVSGLPGTPQTQYLYLGTDTEATLEFGQQQNYFGLFWSSADRLNILEFYRDGELVVDYTEAAFTPFVAATRLYYGNPNPELVGGGVEPWIYLNFFGTSGTTFDLVKIRNKPYTDAFGSVFETDNHSAGFGTFPVTGTVFEELPEVPEPSTFALSIAAAIGAGVIAARRTSKPLRQDAP